MTTIDLDAYDFGDFLGGQLLEFNKVGEIERRSSISGFTSDSQTFHVLRDRVLRKDAHGKEYSVQTFQPLCVSKSIWGAFRTEDNMIVLKTGHTACVIRIVAKDHPLFVEF